MTVPDTPIGGQRLRGVANVDMGPDVGADDFGAGRARELDQLGRAVQGAGDALQRYGIRVYEERARNEAIEADAAYELEQSKDRDRMLAEYRGDQIYSLGDDLAKASGKRAEKIRKGLKTPRARELFDQQRREYDAQNEVLVNRHVVAKAEEYRRSALDAKIGQLRIEAGSLPGDPAVVMHAIRQARELTAEKFRGEPPERVALEQGKAAKAMVETVAAGLEEKYGPAAALSFLDVGDIRGLFTDAEFKKSFGELKKKYETARDQKESDAADTEASLYAFDLVQANKGEIPLDLQETLIRKYGRERGKLAFADARAQAEVVKGRKAEEGKQAAEKRWDGFFRTGEIPDGIGHKEKLAMLNARNRIARGEPSGEPWALGQYLLDNFTPEALKQMQRDGKWGEVYAKLNPDGKKTDIYQDVLDKMNGKGAADGATKGIITPEKYARQQFIAVTGIRPVTANGAKKFNLFMSAFLDETETRAEELGLDDVKKLSRDEQEKILARLLTRGDYGFFGRDKWQYEVDDPADFAPWSGEDQPYERLRRRRQTGAEAADPSGIAAGVRDRLDNGAIVTAAGARQQREGGKIRTEFSRETPKETSSRDAMEQNMRDIEDIFSEGALLP
jgi:hypothetical protein